MDELYSHKKIKKVEKLTYRDRIIVGTDFTIEFDKKGFISQYRRGKNRLLAPIKPIFWRAPIDNDLGNKMDERCSYWHKIEDKMTLLSMTFKQLGESLISVNAIYQLSEDSSGLLVMNYEVLGSGAIEIDMTVQSDINQPDMPAYGVMVQLEKEYSQLNWYGNGPMDSYIDRKKAVYTGYFKGLVSEQWVPYIRPQECGNKTDVMYLEIEDNKGDTFVLKSNQKIEATVLPYTPYEIEAYSHPHLLPESEKTVLRIHGRQMGVGGDDSWQAMTHVEYRLTTDRGYHTKFIIDFR